MIPQLIDSAIDKRLGLQLDPATDAVRIFHGHGDGDPRWDAECFAGTLVLHAYSDLEGDLGAICETFRDRIPLQGILYKERWKKDQSTGSTQGQVLWGTVPDDPFLVSELGRRYWVEPRRGFNSGLFLDARPVRSRIADSDWTGKSVLNLFAYTGSLGICALLGGASSVLHVDSQPALEARIERNYAANSIPFDSRMFVPSDVYRFLKKSRSRLKQWDVIILDPPPVVGPKGKKKRGGQDLERLLPLVRPVLAASGLLILLLNRRERTTEALLHLVQDTWQDVSIQPLWMETSGPEFPELKLQNRLRAFGFVPRS